MSKDNSSAGFFCNDQTVFEKTINNNISKLVIISHFWVTDGDER